MWLAAAAQPTTERIIDRLNSFTPEDRENVFVLSSLERDARKLMNVDPADAHSLLGMIACLRCDPETTRRHHKLSIQIDPSDPNLRSNYAVSLHRLGFYTESIEQYIRLNEVHGSNPSAVSRLVDMLYNTCRPRKALEWLEELERIDPLHDYKHLCYGNASEYRHSLEELCQFLDAERITEDDVSAVLDAAISELHEAKVYPVGVTTRLIDDVDEEVIFCFCALVVHSDPVEVAELNEKIADARALNAGLGEALPTLVVGIRGREDLVA